MPVPAPWKLRWESCTEETAPRRARRKQTSGHGTPLPQSLPGLSTALWICTKTCFGLWDWPCPPSTLTVTTHLLCLLYAFHPVSMPRSFPPQGPCPHCSNAWYTLHFASCTHLHIAGTFTLFRYLFNKVVSSEKRYLLIPHKQVLSLSLSHSTSFPPFLPPNCFFTVTFYNVICSCHLFGFCHLV